MRNESEEEKKNKIFELYKRRLENDAIDNNIRFIVIEYLCRFSKINPIEMGKKIREDGYDILFNDSSISRSNNIKKRDAVYGKQDKEKFTVGTRVIDSDGYKGTITKINKSDEAVKHYGTEMYLVSHDIGKNNRVVNTDGWYLPNMLTSIKQTAQIITNNIISNYEKGNIPQAYDCWCRLYDLYEPTQNMTEEDKYNQLQELHSLTNQVKDDAVYAITDYGREKEYNRMGYYDEIENEEQEY